MYYMFVNQSNFNSNTNQDWEMYLPNIGVVKFSLNECGEYHIEEAIVIKEQAIYITVKTSTSSITEKYFYVTGPGRNNWSRCDNDMNTGSLIVGNSTSSTFVVNCNLTDT